VKRIGRDIEGLKSETKRNDIDERKEQKSLETLAKTK